MRNWTLRVIYPNDHLYDRHWTGEMTMPYAGARRTAVSAALLLSVLLSACGGGDDANEKNTPPQPAPSAAAAQTTVSVALTGLILLLPTSSPPGATKLFMPNVARHVSYVAFAKADATGCDAYNTAFKICFINLERSSLEPIGVPSNTQSTAPPTVLNVTHHTGGTKGDTMGIKGRIRSRATLLSGAGRDSCALARWTIDPVGDPPPVTIEPANVLTWRIPNLDADSLVIQRSPLAGTQPAAKKFIVRATGGRIELLILHVPEQDFEDLRNATTGSGTQPTGPTPDPVLVTQEMKAHVRALYNLVGVDMNKRPFPENPQELNKICPIKVLGLENAVFPADTTIAEAQPLERHGIRTYTCIMGSAESS